MRAVRHGSEEHASGRGYDTHAAALALFPLLPVSIWKWAVLAEIFPVGPVTVWHDLPYVPEMVVRAAHKDFNASIGRAVRSRVALHGQQVSIWKWAVLAEVFPVGP